jgi:hypothetical protein
MNHNISSTDKARTVVIEEEGDYVFVGGDDVDDIDDGRGGLGDLLNLDDGEEEYDEDGWDEVSYDYDRCDLSPSLSCATSVATNVTLRDMNLVVEDADVATSTTAMMDVDDEDDDGGPTPMETEEARYENDRNNFPATSANPKNGRRLSNKKLRKKMKMMKKAAAARALAELKAASMSSSGAGSTSSESTASSSSPGGVKSGVSDGWASLALACARESLLASRIVIEAEKEQLKKTRTVSISE